MTDIVQMFNDVYKYFTFKNSTTPKAELKQKLQAQEAFFSTAPIILGTSKEKDC